MKKLLLLGVPAALILTLPIGYYAYAWICDASATAYNTSNHTYANGTAYATGLNDNYAKVTIKHNPGSGWTNAYHNWRGPWQGSAQMFASRFFPKGRQVKVYVKASGVHDDGTPQVDEPPAATANL
ncbi:MAG: hypothetical protein OXN17_19655 [Candidatus Poribacteria bacterium]|nr:hypothetical protein [Candidatus Poribacteria bacterium]MDE0504020.1 hypothetical protein [Candidatus Poribacteria bacterium]